MSLKLKSALRYSIILLSGLYVLNYLITPIIFGYARLEVICRPRFNQRFDSETWEKSGLTPQRKDNASYSKRYEMVDDILEKYVLLGVEGKKVIEILGKPDGVLDKKSVVALGNPYGIDNSGPGKEILNSPDDIAYWSYDLAYQWQYPARSIWFPKLFLNFDRWKLTIKMVNGKVSKSVIAN